MKLLITGICGFVGSTLAKTIRAAHPDWEIVGIENFSRAGSWINKQSLLELGVQLVVGDIRNASDLETLPACDWVIDAAANPSVLAGVDGKTSSRQLVEHNLQGTINLLEYCKNHQAGFILLSTSRVYSIPGLVNLELEVVPGKGAGRYAPKTGQVFPDGLSPLGVSEQYSTLPPVSLYGSTKVASEHLALEYGSTFDFPVWINRCGVMAGAGQFGHPAQGIFAFWIHAFREGRPLKYIGFDGLGHQVRDCLHPRDLVPIFEQQFNGGPRETKNMKPETSNIVNLSGGLANSMSLSELTAWCRQRFPNSATAGSLPKPDAFPPSAVSQEVRPFDIGWMILDPTLAFKAWNWRPQSPFLGVCEEIAAFAETQANWLGVTIG
ncbi:MAG: NAD-dependent epimerase/dehydratase family protein [Verrucomicrobiota bacterium]